MIRFSVTRDVEKYEIGEPYTGKLGRVRDTWELDSA